MKRILSIFMIAAMLMSIFAVNAAADEPHLYFTENFASAEAFSEKFAWGHFYIEDGLLLGYTEAKALQSIEPYTYVTYDMEMDFAIAEDDMGDITNRHIQMGYPNTDLYENGRAEGSVFFNFHYDVQEKQFIFVIGPGFGSFDEDDIQPLDPVPMELDTDGETYYKMGMSIDRGRIRCFLDGEVIFDFVDTSDQYLIGYMMPQPFFVWNSNNSFTVKELKMGEVGSIYSYETETETTATTEPEPTPTETTTQGSDEPTPTETTTQGDDEPTPTETTTADTTQIIEVTETDDGGNVVTDDGGNAVVKTEIITNAPAPDTVGTTGNVGTSTSTGDATLVVVIAMVAALGSALIVKKVRD